MALLEKLILIFWKINLLKESISKEWPLFSLHNYIPRHHSPQTHFLCIWKQEINVLPFQLTVCMKEGNKIKRCAIYTQKLFFRHIFQCMCWKNDNGECLIQNCSLLMDCEKKLAHVSLDRENTYEDLNYTFLLSAYWFCYKSKSI